MIASGDVVARLDSDRNLQVVVVSNDLHIAARTGRVITCPFVPSPLTENAMSLVVRVESGVVLPELVQWLPVSALGEPTGNIGSRALEQVATIITNLVRP